MKLLKILVQAVNKPNFTAGNVNKRIVDVWEVRETFNTSGVRLKLCVCTHVLK